MPKYDINIKAFGDRAILIEWPQRIDERILDDIISFSKHLEVVLTNSLLDYTSAYASILLRYKDSIIFDIERQIILDAYIDHPSTQVIGKEWEIPVCYDESLGGDQASFLDIGIDQSVLIDLHTANQYRVYMLGFLPGFLYLGGLDERLHLPRKSSPSLSTPARSVAIGGNQTGIYPIQSPGGWHVIGRTPIHIFNIELTPPTPIQQGDYIKFYSITLEQYEALMRG